MIKNIGSETYKTILLTSCGLYPQIITEIIYALSQKSQPVVPQEIHVITTEVGLDNIKSQLLDKKNGHFHKLCKEYGLEDTRFEISNVQLLENAKGIPLEDIETLEENEIVANKISEIVRSLTSRPDTALHVSLTGGRKTISYYLGYALSLFGRSQDRLSHTMVTDAFEADDEFFYPNTDTNYITDREGNKLNTQDAKVQLVEIPFVRLRAGLPISLLEGKATFVEAVASVTSVAGIAQIEIDINNKILICAGKKIELSPILFCWYAWLACRSAGELPGKREIMVRSQDHEQFIAFVEAIYGATHNSLKRAAKSLSNGFTIDYIAEKNSRVNRQLMSCLSIESASYKIQSFGNRPNTKYNLLLEPGNIHIKGEFVMPSKDKK